MSIVDIFMKMPPWYFLMLIVFSLYYGIRAIVEQIVLYRPRKDLSRAEKIIIFYIQEFIFKIIITISAFVALLMANYIFSSLKSINDIGAGTAILLIFLSVWGIIGVSGYLTFLIVKGKVPLFGKGE